MQWNLDVTTGQGTGKVCSLLRGFVKSRFFPIYFTATGAKNIVRYTKDFVIQRFFLSGFHCTSNAGGRLKGEKNHMI